MIEISDISDLRDRIINALHDEQGNLVGKLLTIIDATIQDTTQRKAVKDLVSQAIYSTKQFRRVAYIFCELYAKKLDAPNHTAPFWFDKDWDKPVEPVEVGA